MYLNETVLSSEYLRSFIDTFETQIRQHGLKTATIFMISVRLIPGSPNYVYNVILPHVNGITL